MKQPQPPRTPAAQQVSRPPLDAAAAQHDTTLTPRLARRERIDSASARAWVTPGFGASTAYISLSPGLVCVFDGRGKSGLTHQDIGALGYSAHQAWNAAAEALLSSAAAHGQLRFWVRAAEGSLGVSSPPGYEVRGESSPGAAWLAHPRTFGALHRHCETVFHPHRGLTYYSRDQRELFVFTAPEPEVVDALGFNGVIRYSLGFPLLAQRDAAMV